MTVARSLGLRLLKGGVLMSDALIVFIVIFARFAIPLGIPRFPLPSIIAAMILDGRVRDGDPQAIRNRTGPLRPQATSDRHRHTCRRRSGRANALLPRWSPSSPCRFVHSWVHSWGQTHTGVVTAVAAASHPSHCGHLRRSEQFGSVPSLHTRWTTLGVERHVDLWTKRSSVHSVHAGE